MHLPNAELLSLSFDISNMYIRSYIFPKGPEGRRWRWKDGVSCSSNTEVIAVCRDRKCMKGNMPSWGGEKRADAMFAAVRDADSRASESHHAPVEYGPHIKSRVKEASHFWARMIGHPLGIISWSWVCSSRLGWDSDKILPISGNVFSHLSNQNPILDFQMFN